MAPKFMVETVLLLMVVQGVLGAFGYMTRNWPWVGIVALPVFVFLTVRIARVFREELQRVLRKGSDLEPVRLSFFLGLIWQLPAVAGLPLWAPTWVTELWQGALLPLPRLLTWEPGAWLWPVALLEVALFVWVAARPERKPQLEMRSTDLYTKASGEWAVARRVEDVLAKKGVQKAPDTKE